MLGMLALVFLAAAAWAWFSRERIADNYLGAQLRELGLPATYEIERVGPVQQVLRNIVIGDPKRPDLTIERAEALIDYRFGFPSVGRITVIRPRLYASYRGGKLSLGSLDKVLFAKTEPAQPFRLPDLDVRIVDGRGLLESDLGAVGMKIDGAGRLRSGFVGTLAAIAPEASLAGCRIGRASLYGALSVTREKPHFAGPVRVAAAICPDGTVLEQVGLHVDGMLDPALDGGEARLGLEAGPVVGAGVRANALKGTGRLTYRIKALTARYDLAAEAVTAAAFGAKTLRAEGAIRSQNGLAKASLDGTVTGEGLALGKSLDNTLAASQRATAATPLAAMLGQMRAALQRETPGSSISASYLARRTEAGFALTVPQANLRGGSGQTLVAISRFQLSPSSGGGVPRLSGNIVTGGPGLPQIAGRMERPSRGEAVLRLTMAEYRAGASRLAVPNLVVAQEPRGALGFAGRVVLSGPLPGGAASNLAVPIDGNWSGAGGLSLWRHCTPVAFDRLAFANLTLDRRSVTLCPGPDGAIVRSGRGGTRIAAGTNRLDLSG
ncbi:MAG: C4-dicarboxylate ABC transporter, partial [Novosphingobium sp.]